MKKPKILYHGSSKLFRLLIPKEPNKDLPENSMKAIFSTNNKRIALSMGLTAGKNNSSFMGHKKINFVKGTPKMKYIYLY